MKQYVLVLTALFFSTTNSFFLRRVTEDVHNAVNSLIPHEHRLFPLGKWHHHHHGSQEDGFHHPDSGEHHHGFRKGPPHHRHPDPFYGQDYNPQEKDPLENYEKEEVQPTEAAVQVDATTAVQIETTSDKTQVYVTAATAEEAEGSTFMPIDVRSADYLSSRRLINPGSNCGNGQRADGTGRCRAVFG